MVPSSVASLFCGVFWSGRRAAGPKMGEGKAIQTAESIRRTRSEENSHLCTCATALIRKLDEEGRQEAEHADLEPALTYCVLQLYDPHWWSRRCLWSTDRLLLFLELKAMTSTLRRDDQIHPSRTA